MKRFPLTLGVALLAASQLGASDCGPTQVIRDPGFDIWCGDSLCSWKLVRGDIAQVGTWTEGDSGVAFLGDDTAIQQVSPVTSADGSCIRFSMIADVAENTEVFLDIDLEADGRVERSERVAPTSWQKVTFLIRLGAPYDGIRFELAKRGPGRVVLANIGAEFAGDCSGLPALEPEARPLGAACYDGVACASELCVPSVTTAPLASLTGEYCAGCDPTLGDAACADGEVCGVTAALSPVLAIPITCIPAASRVLAELCISDAECASGLCVRGPSGTGVCSGCKTAADCGGATCGPAWISQGRGPNICRPGERAGTTGAPCGVGADCASGTCAGSPAGACNFDDRPCTNDLQCPSTFDLAPGSCTIVGVQGGTCT